MTRDFGAVVVGLGRVEFRRKRKRAYAFAHLPVLSPACLGSVQNDQIVFGACSRVSLPRLGWNDVLVVHLAPTPLPRIRGIRIFSTKALHKQP